MTYYVIRRMHDGKVQTWCDREWWKNGKLTARTGAHPVDGRDLLAFLDLRAGEWAVPVHKVKRPAKRFAIKLDPPFGSYRYVRAYDCPAASSGCEGPVYYTRAEAEEILKHRSHMGSLQGVLEERK